MNDIDRKVEHILHMHDKVQKLRAILRSRGIDPDKFVEDWSARKIAEFKRLGGTIDVITGEFKPGKLENE